MSKIELKKAFAYETLRRAPRERGRVLVDVLIFQLWRFSLEEEYEGGITGFHTASGY